MKNLIDKSRMNATEKSDKFKKFSKNKRENNSLNFNSKIKSAQKLHQKEAYKLKP